MIAKTIEAVFAGIVSLLFLGYFFDWFGIPDAMKKARKKERD